MKLVNIVVTYNRASKLLKCLQNLTNHAWTDLILVDNNSTEDLLPLLKEFKKKIKIHYYKLSKNIGASGGFNFGIKKFCDLYSDDDYALIHDDDSWPDFDPKKFISEFEPLPNIFSLPVCDLNRQINKMNTPGFANFLNNPLNLLLEKRKLSYKYNSKINVDYASFVGLGINKLIFLRYGLPNKNFFIYSDDTFYTLSLTRLGESITAIRNISFSFIHDCNRMTGKNLIEGRFAFFEVRNKIVLLRKFSRWKTFFIILFLSKSILLSPKRIGKIFQGAYCAMKIDIKEFDNEKI